MAALSCFSQTPTKSSYCSYPKPYFSFSKCKLTFIKNLTLFSSFSYPSISFAILPLRRFNRLSCKCISTVPFNPKNYEFSDGYSEVELRVQMNERNIQNSKNIFVKTDVSSLIIKVLCSGIPTTTIVETHTLYEKIKPAETIWYLDDDQLVINLKKYDAEFKWPDIVESWESLTKGAMQYLKGTSIYLVGNSTEVNEIVCRELADGLGYTPINTKELLETYAKKTIDSWVATEGTDSIVDAECAVFESLSSHVRTVVATLGGDLGAARRFDKWGHLNAGYTLWLSQSEPMDGNSGNCAYSKADATVKMEGWDSGNAKATAQACLSTLKQTISSDKKLPSKKSLYVRLGCCGDWPNIKLPGTDSSSSFC